MEKLKKLFEKLELARNTHDRLLISNIIFEYLLTMSPEEQFEVNDKIMLIDYYSLPYSLKEKVDNSLYADSNIFKYTYFLVNDIFNRSDFKYYDLFPSNKVSSKIQEEIILEVLNEIDSDSLKLYRNLKNGNRINIKPMDERLFGLCLMGYNLVDDEIYINEMIKNSVLYIGTVVHEFGHLYEGKLLGSKSWFSKISNTNAFLEVMSLFFERVTWDYMIKNRVFEDDCQRVLNSEYMNLLDNFTYFDDFLYDAHFKDMEELDEYDCMNFVDEDKKLISIDDVMNSSGSLDYGFGALLGEYFFDIYKQDKKEGLRQIKDFVTKEFTMSDRNLLEGINFFNGDFKFLEKSILDNNSYMRKRYKW